LSRDSIEAALQRSGLTANVPVQVHPDINEGGSADRYQHMCSQPTAALPILALRPNERAEYERAQQTHQRIQKIVEGK
jgi:hypothetical protein